MATSDASPYRGWLVLVGSERLPPATWQRLAALQRGGASVVAWEHPPIPQDRFPEPEILAALEARGLNASSPTRLLGAQAAAIEERVIDWFRELGRRPLAPAGSLRAWARCDGLALWWWLELYLYHETRLRLFVRDVETLAALLAARPPQRLLLVAPRRALHRTALALARCPVERIGRARRARTSRWLWLRALAAVAKVWGTATKRALAAPTPAARPRVLLLTHASMWRPRPGASVATQMAEHYLQPVIDELVARGESWEALAVGPALPFRRRSRAQAAQEMLGVGRRQSLPYTPIRLFTDLSVALRASRALWVCWRQWRTLRRLDSLREALTYRGVDLLTAGRAAFRAAFMLQAPWAVRSWRELRAALVARRPEVLVLYAESSGLGRAALAAARQQGVPSFAIQHGIMYPHYYSYEHAADEVDGEAGCPLPDRTAIFGELARELLTRRGHYPPESLIITGSPRFDRLVATAKGFDARATRQREGVPHDAQLLVVASRLSSLGRALDELIRACDGHAAVWLLLKPHQAESADAYRQIVERTRAPRCRVVDAHADLLELLDASNGLVTVDSFASSEALILGRPVLVLNQPNHLDSLVESGAALGVERMEDLPRQLERFLCDAATLEELERRRSEYVSLFAAGADGRSTARIAQAILDTASRATQH